MSDLVENAEDTFSDDMAQVALLVHLSRRLIGELIVYIGIRHPSTFSNEISSEAVRRILSILHT